MYYDDEARRFNFLSGLVLGAFLGTGMALLFSLEKPRRGAPRHIRDRAETLRRNASDGLEVAGRRARRASVRGLRAAADRMDR